MQSGLYREHLLAVLDWYVNEYGLHPKRETNIDEMRSYITDVPDDELLNKILQEYCDRSISTRYSLFFHQPQSRLARCVKLVIAHYHKHRNYAQYWAELNELEGRVNKIECFLEYLQSKNMLSL